METKRQQKFARVIQKELSEILQKEGWSFHGNSIVTITMVRMSPDLSIAKVYLSIYNAENNELLLNELRSKAREIRFKLGEKIRNQVRIIPNIDFFIDDSMEYVSKMEKLFDAINKPKNEDSGSEASE
ncbi:MAG: ribosome-binding factor RbfA [Bacteroidota bacterium]|jgi:ribosome-binding factor A